MEFVCDICDKPFTRKDNMQRHKRAHFYPEKRVLCPVCGTHVSASALKLHVKAHEKTFKCSICAKSFGLKSNLTRHMRTHSGAKPHGCAICGKRFSQKGNLNAHLRRHAAASKSLTKGPKPVSRLNNKPSFWFERTLTLMNCFQF